MYSTIVHPTDLSDPSIPALKTAHDLAKSLRSRLLICYIAHPPQVASGNTLTDPNTNQTRDIPAEVRAIQPLSPDIDCEIRIVMIDESSSIKPVLAVLENMEGELLVMGVHKKKGISGWFSRSITEEVVAAAHCDVLVVKEDQAAE